MGDATISAMATRLVMGSPAGERARAGSYPYGLAPLPWWAYEWDGSVHCIGCSSGAWSGGVSVLGIPFDAAAFPHGDGCPALALDRAVREG